MSPGKMSSNSRSKIKPSRPRIAVLAGGPDAERAVSIMSGRAIADALRAHGSFDVKYHEIDRLTADQVAAIAADVFFPALHGPWGEGGPLQELLEHDGRPFVGCGSRAARLSMDKLAAKRKAQQAGVPVAPDCILSSPADPCHIDPPLVLKPIDDGSSVDVFICRNRDEFNSARLMMHARRPRFMAEKFIPGREITIGIVGRTPGLIIDIVPTIAFYDYQAKYTRDDTRYIVNPDYINPEIKQTIASQALALFDAIGCRDLARIDFRYDDFTNAGSPKWYLLEINTMPGFTSHSLVPKAEAQRGVTMPQLCAQLVAMALARSTAIPTTSV